MTDAVITKKKGAVLEVTLDRPKANAIDSPTSQELGKVFADFRDDPDMRVAIITGGVSLGLWFSVAMVVLACGIILYNTSNVLHRYNTEQYVAASLTLFASIALLFWYILQIFMMRD